MIDDGINRDELWEVVLVVNGSLEMSPGKLVGQAFQAANRYALDTAETQSWQEDGTRTIVKVAKTQALFDRICDEVHGYVMKDEGFTEVYVGADTLFVSYPFQHKNRPAVLDKKAKLL